MKSIQRSHYYHCNEVIKTQWSILETTMHEQQRMLDEHLVSYNNVIVELMNIFHKDIITVIEKYLKHGSVTVDLDTNKYVINGFLDFYYGTCIKEKVIFLVIRYHKLIISSYNSLIVIIKELSMILSFIYSREILYLIPIIEYMAIKILSFQCTTATIISITTITMKH